MATNEILQFAETDTGTNLLTQAEYLADAQRPIGNQPGVARSKLVNKALRQASLIAAGLAEYIADNQANNVTDALTPQNIADYLQAAITGALGVTPPQFDNDTSLATTAFVQRALGNFSRIRAITSATTLTADDVGRFITCGIGGYSVTLPAASSATLGSSIYFQATTGPVTISRAGGDLISFGDGTSGNSIVLNTGDSLLVTWGSPTSWGIIGGSSQLKYAAAFGSSLAANGYQKLPSGLIIQWGSITFPDLGGTGTVSVTFPITFPNAVLNIVDALGLEGGFNTAAAINESSITASGFQAVISEWNSVPQTGGKYRWLAIGR